MTAPNHPPIQAAERSAICAMLKDIRWGPFGTVDWAEDVSTIERLRALVKEEDFKDLPATLQCPDGIRRLHDSGQPVPFQSFWLSADGRRAAISGGWVAAELTGDGGICYYNRVNDRWQRDACLSTWDI